MASLSILLLVVCVTKLLLKYDHTHTHKVADSRMKQNKTLRYNLFFFRRWGKITRYAKKKRKTKKKSCATRVLATESIAVTPDSCTSDKPTGVLKSDTSSARSSKGDVRRYVLTLCTHGLSHSGAVM